LFTSPPQAEKWFLPPPPPAPSRPKGLVGENRRTEKMFFRVSETTEFILSLLLIFFFRLRYVGVMVMVVFYRVFGDYRV
jgi:hypothetical protein